MGSMKKLRLDGKEDNNTNTSLGNQVELSMLTLILFFF